VLRPVLTFVVFANIWLLRTTKLCIFIYSLRWAMVDLTRRQALATIGGAGASLGLSGCSTPITALCPGDPTVSDPTTPLTIDVHTHVFNGSDLQVAGFYKWVLSRGTSSELASILDVLARNFAPSAAHEMAALQQVEDALRNCNTSTFAQVLNSHREENYQRFRSDLQAASRRVRATRLTRSYTALDRQIETLPKTYAGFRSRRRDRMRFAASSSITDGDLDFLFRNFQFRYVNVYDYLLEYSTGRARKIDLMVAHLVDFDWPIGGGAQTATSLSDQIRVMERISQLTGGRVLCFAPFDPMKEVAFQLGLTTESSLQTVQDAILYHGFIGVKLYPPMGFAPFGNATLAPGFWNRPWIPEQLQRGDLGQLMDDALSRLYAWCLSNGVPIMAHSNHSNGPSNAFEDLATARHWQGITGMDGIRINFGHFGNNRLSGDSQEFCNYMNTAEGRHVYADAAYFSEILDQPAKLQNFLKTLYRDTKSKDDAALAQRLMYGTDWEMIVRERNSGDYLAKFETMFSTLDSYDLGAKGRLSDRFFGVNAAMFLGLGPNQPNRIRLDRYYGLSAKPAWMAKVDRLPVLIS